MIRISPRDALITSILAVIAAAVGCQDPSGSDQRRTAHASNNKPGPEESFALIVETFRRGVEDVPIGFVSRDQEGHSMMTGRNKVSHALIPPANEGDPYKAVITVGSQSNYSIQRSTPEEVEETEGKGEKAFDGLAEEGAGNDVQVFDSELVSSSGREAKDDSRTASAAGENAEKTVTRQADKQERDYELVYQDGKWVLITQLDPETEQSIENAFKRALAMQN